MAAVDDELIVSCGFNLLEAPQVRIIINSLQWSDNVLQAYSPCGRTSIFARLVMAYSTAPITVHLTSPVPSAAPGGICWYPWMREELAANKQATEFAVAALASSASAD